MNQLSTKWMLSHIPQYQVSLNPKVSFPLSCFEAHPNIIHKRWTDKDVMIKINTLMLCFCFEIWIYYKWAPDKQTHGWLPPDVLRGLQSLHRNNATAVMKGNGKSSACHVLSPCPSAWKSCFRRAGQNIHIPGFDMEIIWTQAGPQIHPFLILRRLVNSGLLTWHTSHPLESFSASFLLCLKSLLPYNSSWESTDCGFPQYHSAVSHRGGDREVDTGADKPQQKSDHSYWSCSFHGWTVIHQITTESQNQHKDT